MHFRLFPCISVVRARADRIGLRRRMLASLHGYAVLYGHSMDGGSRYWAMEGCRLILLSFDITMLITKLVTMLTVMCTACATLPSILPIL